MPRRKKALELKIDPTDSDEKTVILYQPQKGGRELSDEEKLTLTFTNTGQGDIELNTDGNAAVVLYIHDAVKEFTEAEVKRFNLNNTLSDAKVEWTLQVIKNGYNSVQLTPNDAFTLKENESIHLIIAVRVNLYKIA